MGFDPKISGERLKRVLNDICSLGPRWQGNEGGKKVVNFLERFLAEELSVNFIKEDFSYIGFNPQKTELIILDSPRKSIPCQPLAYSASKAVEGELVYISEDKLDRGNFSDQIVLSDALKSYQAYPKVYKGEGAGFILGSNLPENLLRVGTTNYERKIGNIPAISVGAEDTQLLKKKAIRGTKVRLEVLAHYRQEKGYNLIVQLRREIAKPKFLVCSHYDSMWLGPHAFDNASGTAAILELIGCFKGSPYNLDFLLCGAEELGFWGSNAYVERHHQECSEIAAVICLDGICSDLGPVEVGVTEDLASRIRDLVDQRAFRVDQWSIPPRPNSDHVSFGSLGTPVFWLTTIDPYYHTAADIPEHIGEEKLKRHTALVIQVIMNLSDRTINFQNRVEKFF